MSFLRKFGKATTAILALALGPQVGKDDLVNALGYIENAGAPSSVVPEFIGQKLFDTSNSIWYRSFGVAVGEWTQMGSAALSAAELAVLDGATAGAGVASKAVVLDAEGDFAFPTGANSNGAPGVGISGGSGTVFKTTVFKEGSIIRTQILIDLTGLNGGGTAGDVIGVNGAGVAHLGQLTVAKNGTVLGGRMTCLETPAGSNVDVDLWAANEATGVEDTAISALTGEVQLINHGDWAAGEVAGLVAPPVADQYLYLTSGAATDATFTAGQFLIEFYGYV